MNTAYSGRLVIPIALVSALLLSQLAMGELAARLVVDPRPAGLSVNVDNPTFEGNLLGSIQLTVENNSTNVLTIDAARSSFTTPDGQARQFSAIEGNDFTTTLLPGEQASATIVTLVAVGSGAQLKAFLVWTLGAVVSSATWVWEMAEVAAPALPPTAAPAEGSTPTAPEMTAGDYAIGLVGLALGLALLALLGWGLWSLVSLLW